MSSLRAFRLSKPARKEDEATNSSDVVASEDKSSPLKREESEVSVFNKDTPNVMESSQEESPFKPLAKRPRMISDDDSDGENGKNGANGANGSSAAIPDADDIESKLDQLQKDFPNKDRMDLQDALSSSNWEMLGASLKLRPESPKAKSFSKGKGKKKASVKRHETREPMSDMSESEGEYDDNGMVFDSSDSEDEVSEVSDKNLSADKRKVLDFFCNGTEQELAGIQGCSKKKVKLILELRPFEGWSDLVRKLQISKSLSTDMLNHTTGLLRMRDAVSKLMERCEKITKRMESMVLSLTSGNAETKLEVSAQPKSITAGFNLTGYQMIGLNWLVLMHRQNVNGILADEMGLGKTIQTIAFLAHLKEMGDEGPHLIIVPSSTMENWQKELALWCPDITVLNYYGSQDERRHMRLQIVQEQIPFDVILTTYNMVISSPDDRVLFRKLDFHYVVFDEAHMLKNMSTARYENLMRVQASRKLLLTGTPLQNNLVELMSLLVFVMPDMFANKKEQLKKMFMLFPKNQEDTGRSLYEKGRIAHAKRIMKPFFLRRLKSEVLTELPKKSEEIMRVPMTAGQHEMYIKLVSDYKKRAKEIANGATRHPNESGVGLLMNLRKAANHPLLIRNHYDKQQIGNLAKILKKQDAGHAQAVEKFIREDFAVMSDYYIHKTCLSYRSIENYSLGNYKLCESGKFEMFDRLLPGMKDNDDRVLIFTQFTMVLDIMEDYLKIRGHKYLRLDGGTPVTERQSMIDDFNHDDSIFIFILSTKAGGLGINLTAANTVILHDLDFNPYNDKQAEDRCHRVGQTRPVRVIRMLSEETIEEAIHNIATDKLKLEQDLNQSGEEGNKQTTNKKDLKSLLKLALDVEMSEEVIGEVDKVYCDL